MFDGSFYAARYALSTLQSADLWRHYCHHGRFSDHDPNELFSTAWYLAQNPDVRRFRLNPLDHYLERGAREGRDPGPNFNSWLYWLLNPDVKASGMNPLLHFLRHGRDEGRLAPTADLFARIAGTPAGSPRVAPAPCPSPEDSSRDPAPPPIPTGHGRLRRRKGAAEDAAAARVIERRCAYRVRWFATLFARDLEASFEGVRLLGTFPARTDGPLVIITNHPSWWDAELYHWLAVTGFPDRRGFAPMESSNLDRHPILTRLGAFPTRPGGFAGAASFLATAERLLDEPDAALFVAAEGRFRDIRQRPVRVMPGVAHLARSAPHATFVPLAIDYVFWKHRRPNLLLHFGPAMPAAAFAGCATAEIAKRLGIALEATIRDLEAAGMARQPALFRTLLERRGLAGALLERWSNRGRPASPIAARASRAGLSS